MFRAIKKQCAGRLEKNHNISDVKSYYLHLHLKLSKNNSKKLIWQLQQIFVTE